MPPAPMSARTSSCGKAAATCSSRLSRKNPGNVTPMPRIFHLHPQRQLVAIRAIAVFSPVLFVAAAFAQDPHAAHHAAPPLAAEFPVERAPLQPEFWPAWQEP